MALGEMMIKMYNAHLLLQIVMKMRRITRSDQTELIYKQRDISD